MMRNTVRCDGALSRFSLKEAARGAAAVFAAFSAPVAAGRLAALRRAVAGAAAAVLATVLAAASPVAAQPIVVGGKAFTEQYVLAEITKQLLEREGYEAVTRVGYSTGALREAMLAAEVGVSWDYTWTGYAIHNGLTDPKPADAVLEDVRALDAPRGLIWLDRSRVNNTYAFAVNLDFAAENCIHSMNDLAQALRNGLQLTMASDQECHQREDCLPTAESVYGFDFPDERISAMNVSETYEMLRERSTEIAIVYTTDGKIPAYDLELLDDPESVFAEYFLTPVIRADLLEAEPALGALLNRISESLDQATSQDLHYRVDVVGQPIDQVARYFIRLKGL